MIYRDISCGKLVYMDESDIESFCFIEISRIDSTKTIVILWSLDGAHTGYGSFDNKSKDDKNCTNTMNIINSKNLMK